MIFISNKQKITQIYIYIYVCVCVCVFKLLAFITNFKLIKLKSVIFVTQSKFLLENSKVKICN